MFLKKTITLLSAAVLLAIGAKAQTTSVPVSNTAGQILDSAEQMPEYPGGKDKMIKFLCKTIRYPEVAREKGIQGKVYVRFVVAEDGTLSDVGATTHLGGGLEEEAVRVVNKMPKWTPAMQQGKPVKVYFTMPIGFWLE